MKYKVVITGSTGMVGGILLKQCLENEIIGEVVSLVRKATGTKHSNLTEIVVNDFLNYDNYSELLKGVDIIFYCLGVYTGAVPAMDFRTITVDYPVALAKRIFLFSPDARFCLLSGQGADRTEKSNIMFARDKGAAENQLSAIGFKSFHSFRPGYIYPVTPRKEPNITYRISRIIYPIIKLLGGKFSITSTKLAAAMLHVGINGYSKEIFENKDIRAIV